MPATIVDPPASMTCTLGGRSPSSVLERIQTTRPASTRTLASFRNDGPLGSARAASRYKVGRGMIIETSVLVRLTFGVQRGCRRTRPTAAWAEAAPPSRGRPGTEGRGRAPRGHRDPRRRYGGDNPECRL